VAGSDAIDSNGNITISGGITIIDGPATGVEEGIDFNGTFLINGGTLISGGSNSDMTKAASTASTQVNFLLKSSTALASTSLLHIQNSSGTEVVTYKPKNNVYYFHVSTSALAKNTSYSVYFGGTYTGGSYVGGLTTWGLLTGGTWSSTGASLKKTFTTSASSTVNTVTFSGSGATRAILSSMTLLAASSSGATTTNSSAATASSSTTVLSAGSTISVTGNTSTSSGASGKAPKLLTAPITIDCKKVSPKLNMILDDDLSFVGPDWFGMKKNDLAIKWE
jgi:hypothetical protein